MRRAIIILGGLLACILAIQPTRLWGAELQLVYSSYFAGNAYDRAHGCTFDAAGNIYLGFNTSSTDLPTTPGAFQRTYKGVQDGYVCKLTPDGKTLLWGTYLGGNGEDRVYNVRVDAAGYVYAVGNTGSADFPTTPGAYDPTKNSPANADIFVAKLTPDGSALAYSTFVGGTGYSYSRGVMSLDPSDGSIWVAGTSDGTSFPVTTNGYQRTFAGGGYDAVLFKLSPDGSRLLYSTYLGGSGTEAAFGVWVHSDGTIFVSGFTDSRNFPVTAGAYQTVYGGESGLRNGHAGDAWVARFSATGGLLWSTYIGGSNDDQLGPDNGFAVDAAGRAVLRGSTFSSNFPTTPGVFQPAYRGKCDTFVTKISADGRSLYASTFLGGTELEMQDSGGLALDVSGNVYFSDTTESTNYPLTSDAFQSVHHGGPTYQVWDATLVKLSSDLKTLLYSTYLGGNGYDRPQCTALGPGGKVMISGDTGSTNFPVTAGAYQTTARTGNDAWFTIFQTANQPPVINSSPTAMPNPVSLR